MARPSSATAARRSHDLGQRIRAARDAAGLSQRELAAATGKHLRAVQAWELGECGLTWDSARLVCQALDVTEDYLLTPGWDELPVMSEVLERMDELEQRLERVEALLRPRAT